MNLVKTSLLNGLAVITKLGTTLVLNKVLAVYVGPTGYAVIGQFQNLVAMVGTLASGGISTGVTKYTAEYHADPAQQLRVWRTAVMLGLGGSLTAAGLLVWGREPFSRWTLGDAALSDVMLWLAASVVLLVLNGLMLAILNGRKAVRAYVAATICGSLLTAASATALVLAFQLKGALVALAVSQALAFCATAWLFHRECRVSWRQLVGRIDRATARRLGGFAVMGVTSAVVVPLSLMLVREGLARQLGWHQAGLWQALWKISETHLMLITTTLSLYFLPRFSEIGNGPELQREVLKGYRLVLPLVTASALLIYLLRDVLIRALLTAEFLPLADVLGWQLLGDVLKVCSWVVGYTLVSHARVRTFVVTEVAFSGLFAALTLLGAALDGLRGASAAYALTYLLHGAVMVLLFHQLVRRSATVVPA